MFLLLVSKHAAKRDFLLDSRAVGERKLFPH